MKRPSRASRWAIAVLIFAASIFLSFGLSAQSQEMKNSLSRLAATKGSFTFAVIGDNRSGDRVYAKIIYQTMFRKPLFVVNTGDIIPHPGDREEWSHFKEISRPIDVPYFLTPGNHDIDDERTEQIWRDEVDLPGNETFYSFTVGKNLFVVLNSCEPKAERKIIGNQFEWLSRTLDPVRYEHQFVFLHHPLFMWKGATHERESLDRHPKDRDHLHQLFIQKKVDAVFAGHEHLYRRMEKDGVYYIITGGAGAPLYGKGEFNNVMLLNIDGARVVAKVVDRDGMLRDEFVMYPRSK